MGFHKKYYRNAFIWGDFEASERYPKQEHTELFVI
jgi:hypothetical protein